MRYKIFAIIFTLSINSCVWPYFTSPYYRYKRSKSPRYNVEIYCPIENLRVVVTRTTTEEVAKAIDEAIKKEIKEKNFERHSVLILQVGRGFLIENLPPSRLRYCRLREALRDEYVK